MITVGCLIWGVMTVGFSISSSLREAIFFWAINGLGLSLVIPNVQVNIHASRPSCPPSIMEIIFWGGAMQLGETNVCFKCVPEGRWHGSGWMCRRGQISG